MNCACICLKKSYSSGALTVTCAPDIDQPPSIQLTHSQEAWIQKFLLGGRVEGLRAGFCLKMPGKHTRHIALVEELVSILTMNFFNQSFKIVHSASVQVWDHVSMTVILHWSTFTFRTAEKQGDLDQFLTKEKMAAWTGH